MPRCKNQRYKSGGNTFNAGATTVLKDDPGHPKALEKYLNADNQTFLSWKQLVNIVRPLENRPKFSDLLVCEFPQSLEMNQLDEQVLNKIIDRINMVASKKCVFLISQEGSLDQYIKNIDMPVFLKIDEYENTVTSITYGDNIEALIKESSKGHLEEVNQLLEDGVEVNSVFEPEGLTALETAAGNGHKDIVLTLLIHEVPISPQLELALIKAACNGHKEAVLLLLENGANANFTNNLGWTPLRTSVSNGHVDVVRALLEHGADVDDESCKPGLTPLHIAVENNKIEIIRTLLDHRAQFLNVESKGTPLHLAVKYRHINVLSVLIPYVDVDIKNHRGETALHVAVDNNFNDMVDLLISYGANVNAQCVSACTPLHIAVGPGRGPLNVEVIKTLLNNGAENLASRWFRSPLHLAAQNGEDLVVLLLLENKVEPNITGTFGNTALHEGVQYGNINIVKLLLKHGAYVNAQNDDGQSPLHLRIYQNLTEMLQTLLDRDDIDINAKDNRDFTPLHAAVRNSCAEAVEILITRGARRDIRNKDGKTALDMAEQPYCDRNILALLKP